HQVRTAPPPRRPRDLRARRQGLFGCGRRAYRLGEGRPGAAAAQSERGRAPAFQPQPGEAGAVGGVYPHSDPGAPRLRPAANRELPRVQGITNTRATSISTAHVFQSTIPPNGAHRRIDRLRAEAQGGLLMNLMRRDFLLSSTLAAAAVTAAGPVLA